MALSSTLFTFEIELADADRSVYESLTLRVPCHPSETEEFLLTRVLAYCLEHAEGIAFSSGGLSSPDEPAISVCDLTGALRSWIEVGAPSASRLHLASKASPRVVVYTHADPARLLRSWEGERIHRAEGIELVSFDRAMVAALQSRLQRRMTLSITVSGGQLYVGHGGETLEGAIDRRPIASG